MKDTTCRWTAKWIWHNVTQYYSILPASVAALTTFPCLLTCFTRLAGRSNGSSSGTCSCPAAPVETGRGRRTFWGWSRTACALTRLAPRPRPRPSRPRPRASDVRPMQRWSWSWSSDSVAASTAAAPEVLLAASAFLDRVRVVGAGLASIAYRIRWRRTCNGSSSRSRGERSLQSSICVAIVTQPLFLGCGPVRNPWSIIGGPMSSKQHNIYAIVVQRNHGCDIALAWSKREAAFLWDAIHANALQLSWSHFASEGSIMHCYVYNIMITIFCTSQ